MTRLWSQGKPVEVVVGADATLRAFRCFGRRWEVVEVCNRWRVREGWWQEEGECWREYHKLLTRKDLLCLLFHDLHRGGWFLERVYD